MYKRNLYEPGQCSLYYSVVYAELLAEWTRLFYTDCTVMNNRLLLSRILGNVICIGFEVSKVDNYNHFEQLENTSTR
jgi:hypothetical protein